MVVELKALTRDGIASNMHTQVESSCSLPSAMTSSSDVISKLLVKVVIAAQRHLSNQSMNRITSDLQTSPLTSGIQFLPTSHHKMASSHFLQCLLCTPKKHLVSSNATTYGGLFEIKTEDDNEILDLAHADDAFINNIVEDLGVDPALFSKPALQPDVITIDGHDEVLTSSTPSNETPAEASTGSPTKRKAESVIDTTPSKKERKEVRYLMLHLMPCY